MLLYCSIIILQFKAMTMNLILSYMHPNHRWDKCSFCLVPHDISCQMIHDVPWHSPSTSVFSGCVTLWKALASGCCTSALIHFTLDTLSYEWWSPVSLFIQNPVFGMKITQNATWLSRSPRGQKHLVFPNSGAFRSLLKANSFLFFAIM